MRLFEWEETLGIDAWGNWARWSAESEVGIKAPGWTKLYRPKRRPDAPTLSDDDGLALDSIILKSSPMTQMVAILVHVEHLPQWRIVQLLKISRRQIYHHRWRLVDLLRENLKKA